MDTVAKCFFEGYIYVTLFWIKIENPYIFFDTSSFTIWCLMVWENVQICYKLLSEII